jgi:L-lactate dehydrogenase complex protein LldG
MYDPNHVLQKVCQSLGRSAPETTPPVPPAIEEHVARLVSSEIGLPELFAQRAAELKMLVEVVSIDDLVEKLGDFLVETKCHKVMLTDTPIIRSLDIGHRLMRRGLIAKYWSTMTLDETYDFDAGVTEVDYAVAETGSVVIRHRPEHGRAISLVPFVHVAIIQPKNFLPDMIDLFEKLSEEGTGSGVTMIAGPSKTADIELNVVTGVHGPNIVKAYILG